VDIAKHLGSSSYNHIITDGGMALALLLAGSPQGYTLIKGNIIAYLSRLPYNHAHTMINKQPFPYTGPGMNLYTCEKAVNLRNNPAQELKTFAPEEVGYPVKEDGMEARVAQDNL
jgi:hypothetical protein